MRNNNIVNVEKKKEYFYLLHDIKIESYQVIICRMKGISFFQKSDTNKDRN